MVENSYGFMASAEKLTDLTRLAAAFRCVPSVSTSQHTTQQSHLKDNCIILLYPAAIPPCTLLMLAAETKEPYQLACFPWLTTKLWGHATMYPSLG